MTLSYVSIVVEKKFVGGKAISGTRQKSEAVDEKRTI
jgi:hypothetical protein